MIKEETTQSLLKDDTMTYTQETSLKFFFGKGGEQFIVGIQTAKKIGLKETIRIPIAGVSFAVILFFLLYYSHGLISTRWLELALRITLYFFAAKKKYVQRSN